MGTSWLHVGLLTFGALLLVKYAMLQSSEACAHDVVSGYARRRSVRSLFCSLLMECMANKGQRGSTSYLCTAMRSLDWLLEQVPPLHSLRESMITAMILFLLVYKDNVSAILEDWGFPGLGGWRWVALDGVDAEADLPDLEEVAAEAVDRLPPEGGRQPGQPAVHAGVNGLHHHEASSERPSQDGEEGAGMSTGGCHQCERCRAGGGGSERVTVSKRVRPEGWLVYDKVVGVVPYEVLEHWKTEEEGRKRGRAGHGLANGHGARGHEGLPDSGGSSASSRPRARPPVRRPPKPTPANGSTSPIASSTPS